MEKIPEIRFDGFTGDWEQRKLGELLEFHNGFNGSSERYGRGIPLISVMDILSNDFITSENVRTKADLTEAEFQRFKVGYGDVLFQRSSENVADAGTSNVYLDERKCAVFGGFVICGKKKSEYVPLFLKYGLTNKDVRAQIMSKAQGAQHINVSQDTLQGTEILLPSQYEQEKIGNYFRNFDTLITLHQRKYEKLKNFKVSMLNKMFPKEGESEPEIRFDGFTEPWEQRKLGEIISKYEDPVPTPHDGYYRLGIRSHAKGTFHSYVAKGQELETAQMHRVAAGNFIVNITFGWEHDVAITDENDAGKLVSHRFPQFSFDQGMVPEFFRYVIVDEKFRHHLWLSSPGGAGRNRVLKIDEKVDYLMRFPAGDEQIKIAEFFRNLDHLITLHQRKYEKLLDCKKAFLAKMFGGEF